MINFNSHRKNHNLIEGPISEFLSGVNAFKHPSVEFYIHSLMNIVTSIKSIQSSMHTHATRDIRTANIPDHLKPSHQMSANLRNVLDSLDFQNKNSWIGHCIASYEYRTGRGRNINQYCHECKQLILRYLEQVYPAAEQKKFEEAATRMRTQFR